MNLVLSVLAVHHFIAQVQKKEHVICKQCQIQKFQGLKNILEEKIKNKESNQSNQFQLNVSQDG